MAEESVIDNKYILHKYILLLGLSEAVIDNKYKHTNTNTFAYWARVRTGESVIDRVLPTFIKALLLDSPLLGNKN